MWIASTIMILVQLIKDVLPESIKKFIPIICVFLAIVANYFLWEYSTIQELFIQGTTIWLASSGLYQGVKGLMSKDDIVLFNDDNDKQHLQD